MTDQYKAYFRSNIPKDVEIVFPESGDKEFLLKQAKDTDLFVGFSLTEEFMSKATKLRHIQIPWTGFNNLRVEFLKGRENITVSNSHSNSLAIAEHAVSLLLSAAKLITHRDADMRKDSWETRYNQTNSFWLTGKKLGIIGYGSIGKKAAAMLKPGFNMSVLAIKRNPTEKDELCDFIGGMNELDHVLKESDYLIIAVPLTEETTNLIDREQFSLMKQNAVISNIARGPVINEEALYNALKSNRIGAAGIDVWYNYPNGNNHVISQNYPFHELTNIVMTPHSAFKIRDREEIFAEDILTNILNIYHNKSPINQVHLELGY